jgi:transposase InsO family protein
VLAWRTTITLETAFCLEALEQAFERGQPEIFNNDQGSQFTSTAFFWPLGSVGLSIPACFSARLSDPSFPTAGATRETFG